jgi:hypothetical protein
VSTLRRLASPHTCHSTVIGHFASAASARACPSEEFQFTHNASETRATFSIAVLRYLLLDAHRARGHAAFGRHCRIVKSAMAREEGSPCTIRVMSLHGRGRQDHQPGRHLLERGQHRPQPDSILQDGGREAGDSDARAGERAQPGQAGEQHADLGTGALSEAAGPPGRRNAGFPGAWARLLLHRRDQHHSRQRGCALPAFAFDLRFASRRPFVIPGRGVPR